MGQRVRLRHLLGSTGARPAGTLITSWFDADLPTLDKGLTRLSLDHSVLQTGESILVFYALDDSAVWVGLGAAYTVGSAVTVLNFPVGVHARRFRYRFLLTVAATGHGPQLRSAATEYNLASETVAADPGAIPPVEAHTKHEWTFSTLLAGVPGKELVRIDETAEPLTGAQLSDRLWVSKLNPSGIAYTDIDTRTYTVTFADLDEEIDGGGAERATRGVVRLVEV
jgi:hypothetical protein